MELDAEITGNSKIGCGVGATNVVLRGNRDDYRIRAEKGIGAICIGGDIYNSSDTKEYGNGKNYLEVEGGIGRIDIDFVN